VIWLFWSDTKISSTYFLLHFGKYKRHLKKWLSWPWSYGSWIYNYLCNQRISPLMLWVQISTRMRCTTLCDKFGQWLATGWCFSPGPPVSSTNKSDRYDITELSMKVALNTIKQTSKHFEDISRYVSDPHIYDKQISQIYTTLKIYIV
jgi:hypothetical protein